MPRTLRTTKTSSSSSIFLLAAVAGCIGLLGTAACESESAPVGGGGQGGAGGLNTDDLTPQEFYVQVVHPELDASCGGCHAFTAPCVPTFMADTAEASYQALKQHTGLVTASPNSNLIYHGAHNGPALTLPQEELVQEWLDREFPDGATGKTLKASLIEFGDCMTREDFDLYEVSLLAYQQTADGPCGSCHRTGEAGTWIGYNDDETFTKNTRIPWIKRLVEPVYEGNEFVDLAASKRFVKKVEEAGLCESSHPAALVPAQIEQNLDDYFAATHNRWANNACSPSQ